MPHDETVEPEKVVSAMVVKVKGKKDGDTIIYELFLNGQMGPATGIPCSIGAEMIAQGQISAKGVLAPEECIDPKPFLDEFIRRAKKVANSTIREKVSTLAAW